VQRILERGNTSDRMREVVQHCEGLPELVNWLEAESQLGTGMDRRLEQRDPPCAVEKAAADEAAR
jgi:hypothetical protein